jgi:glucose-6-phosphate dehydrogenase assembly protein OpcA
MTTPLVALQKPTDISLNEIEAALNQIWQGQTGEGFAVPSAIRATTFSMVIYEPEEFQQLLAALGFYDGAIDGFHGDMTKSAVRAAQNTYGLRITGRVDQETLTRLRKEYAKLPPEKTTFQNTDTRGFSVSEAIAAQNPCRVITLCPTLGMEEGVNAQVSAYCPIQKSGRNNLICCEYITLRGTKASLNQVGDLVSSLMVSDLPKFVWWKATPNPDQDLFRQLADCCHCIILDSCYFSDPESEFLKMQELIESETYVADLNWHRLSAWQELTAAAYDPPERRDSLVEIDRVTIDYEKGNAAQALMFLGWLASRLNWEPTAYEESGGDYDLTHIRFQGMNQKEIVAELAAIPVADAGEVIGDLIGLKLSSTNTGANCATILCSETTGCMRLEAGGSAQFSRTEQVTALPDQKAEYLMGQQLQRWGRDVLYEESLAVTAQILKLRQG